MIFTQRAGQCLRDFANLAVAAGTQPAAMMVRGVCHHDGWDFSRCSPGLATRVISFPSTVLRTPRRTLLSLPNGCAHVVMSRLDGKLRGTAISEVSEWSCISPSTSCPQASSTWSGPCCRDVKFHGLEPGSFDSGTGSGSRQGLMDWMPWATAFTPRS